MRDVENRQRTVGLLLSRSIRARSLLRRPRLLGKALLHREEASSHAVEVRSTDRTSLFGRTITPAQAAEAQRVMQLRLDRLLSFDDEGATLRKADVAPLNETPVVGRIRPDAQSFAREAAYLLDPSYSSSTEISVGELMAMNAKALAAFVGRMNKTDRMGTAARLLTFSPGASNTRVRVAKAKVMLEELVVTPAAIDRLLELADTYRFYRKPRNEFAAIHMIGLLGAFDKLEGRLERLSHMAQLTVLASAPAIFVWENGQSRTAEARPQAADLIVVDGQLPPYLRGAVTDAAYFTPRSLVREQVNSTSLVQTFAGFYSVSEAMLSLRTEQVSVAVCEAYTKVLEGSTLAHLAPLVNACAIQLDDTLFSALLPFAAIETALRGHRPKVLEIICEQQAFAEQVAELVAHALPECVMYASVLNPSKGTGTSDEAEAVTTPSPEKIVGDTLNMLQNFGIATQAIDSHGSASENSVLLCGRPFIPNYIQDVRAFATHAARRGQTHLLITGNARAVDGKTASLADVMPERKLVVVWDQATDVVRKLSGRDIPESLKDHGADVVSEILRDREHPLAHILHTVEPQLRRYMERVLPAGIVSAAMVDDMVGKVRPECIICLPSRDWLAQMAVISARRRLGNTTRSFDIQTVFIGPRLRYRQTICDYQMAIETNSVTIFAKHFSLSPDRILVGGSPRYAATYRAAKAALETRAPSGGAAVLFTASPIMTRCLPLLDVLVEVVGQMPGATLHVRPHPATTPGDMVRLRDAIVPLANRAVSTAATSLAQALADADLVVTRFSNTGLEAAMIGKPVIAADFFDLTPPISLGDMGVAIAVHTPADLKAAIVDVIQNGIQMRLLAKSRTAYFQQNPQLLADDPSSYMWSLILGHLPDLKHAGRSIE